ncbi:MAG: hypothetical protein ACI9KN_001390 [Gammaproteobacteria bacterium]
MKAAVLASALTGFGLHLRGVFTLDQNDLDNLALPISRLSNRTKLSIALVGNIGSSYWPQFSSSVEFTDGLAHPLDRWSKRIAGQLASEHDVSPVFPSDGPPYLPFQQWAKRAEGLSPSPLGLLIHPQYGLWHAYRFALVVATDESPAHSVAPVESPCISCLEQPCLNTCPVGAFTVSGYDVPKCAEYLKKNPDSNCNRQGCQARLSCPVAEDYRYVDGQHLFHLRAFVGEH